MIGVEAFLIPLLVVETAGVLVSRQDGESPRGFSDKVKVVAAFICNKRLLLCTMDGGVPIADPESVNTFVCFSSSSTRSFEVSSSDESLWITESNYKAISNLCHGVNF